MAEKKYVSFWSEPELVKRFERAIRGQLGTRSDHLRRAMEEYAARLENSQPEQESDHVAA